MVAEHAIHDTRLSNKRLNELMHEATHGGDRKEIYKTIALNNTFIRQSIDTINRLSCQSNHYTSMLKYALN